MVIRKCEYLIFLFANDKLNTLFKKGLHKCCHKLHKIMRIVDVLNFEGNYQFFYMCLNYFNPLTRNPCKILTYMKSDGNVFIRLTQNWFP